MTSKHRLKALEKITIPRPVRVLMVFYEDLKNLGIYKCSDGKKYTQAEVDAVKAGPCLDKVVFHMHENK